MSNTLWRNRTSKSKKVQDWRLNKNERMKGLFELFANQQNGQLDLNDTNPHLLSINNSIENSNCANNQETLFVKYGETQQEQFPAKLLFMNYHRQELIKKFTSTQRNIDIETLKRIK